MSLCDCLFYFQLSFKLSIGKEKSALEIQYTFLDQNEMNV